MKWPLRQISPCQAAPCEVSFSEDKLPSLVERLAKLAADGPHPPLNALQEPVRCRRCGYQAQCFDQRSTRDELTSLALGTENSVRISPKTGNESNCRLLQQCGRISAWQYQCTQL